MSRLQRIVLLLLSDVAAINLASVLFLWMKFVGAALAAVQHSWNRLQPCSQSSAR